MNSRVLLLSVFASIAVLLQSPSLGQPANDSAAQTARQSAADHRTASGDRPATQLQYTPWSGELVIPDPVSIAFDSSGRAYVTQTQRRKIQDLDIRQHQDWIPDDLRLDSVIAKREFYRQELSPDRTAGPNQANSRHVADLNQDGSHDYSDLAVIGERIHLVTDSDGDGTADQIRVFAEDFKTDVTGIAAGVLHFNGDVYATIAPDVWRMRDQDGDGAADTRDVMATGFGLHIAYAGHDMHGLTVGPDGKIYWSIGDKGVNVTSKEGRRFYYPNQGAVLRCNPDGSDFEVFAHGLRNVQELAFDQFGNLFGFDNDSDQPGEKERFVNIVFGMDAGWRCNYQYRGSDYNPWVKERMWEPLSNETEQDQPRYIVPAIANSVDGPCGLAFNPGTALSTDYKDYFFLTSTMGGEQLSFKIQPQGDSFKLVNQHQIGKGIPMIGINFGPDGGLYGVDWGGGYPLNKEGKIWKIDDNTNPDPAQVAVRKQIAAELRKDYAEIDLEHLVQSLGSPDQRVRLKAQFELVQRKSLSKLSDAFAQSAEAADELSRLKAIHCVWGIGQLARQGNKAAVQWFKGKLEFIFVMPEPVLVSIVRTAGEIPGLDGMDSVFSSLLSNGDPQVRQAAAIAIGRLGIDSAFPSLVKAAAQLKPNETYLRHAISYGMAGIEYKDNRNSKKMSLAISVKCPRLDSLARSNNEMVRTCGIVAIRKLAAMHKNDERPLWASLSNYLDDSSEAIAIEAARTIHDDYSIVQELPQLAARLNETSLKQESFLRRAINANYRMGDASSLSRVVEFALNTSADSELRVEALKAIGSWSNPDQLDRVTGRYRGMGERNLSDESLALVKSRLLNALGDEVAGAVVATSAEGQVQTAVAMIAALRGLELDIPRSQLLKICRSKLPADIRAEALSGVFDGELGSAADAEATEVLTLALVSESPLVRNRALEVASRHKPKIAIKTIAGLLMAKGKVPAEVQLATSLLTTIANKDGDRILLEQLERLRAGKLRQSLLLETMEAARQRSSQNPQIKTLLETIESQRIEIAAKVSASAPDKEVADFMECLAGGDRDIGKQIFNTHIDAQCVRCHRVGKEGSNVGPELSGVAVRNPAKSDSLYLLRSIIAPSSQIVEKYQTVLFLLASGQTVQGVVLNENDETITVVDAAGKEIKIDVEEIDDESKQKVSIMPVAETLTKREIRDLVAYLKTLKSKPKQKK